MKLVVQLPTDPVDALFVAIVVAALRRNTSATPTPPAPRVPFAVALEERRG